MRDRRCRSTVDGDATPAALRPSARRLLPRDEPRRRAAGDLRRRRRPPPVQRAPSSRGTPLRLEPARVLPHAEPLPPRGRGRARAPLARHAPARLPLRPGVQPPPRSRRPPVSGPLPRHRRRERRAPRGGLRLRARQSAARLSLHVARGVAMAWRRVAWRRSARRPTPGPVPAPARAPTSRRGRRRRGGRSAAGSRERARPASACESASSPRR